MKATKFLLAGIMICSVPVEGTAQTGSNLRLAGARFVAFGTTLVSAGQGGWTFLQNPATLAMIQDAQITLALRERSVFNAAGLASFFPSFGTLAVSYARLDGVARSPSLNHQFRRFSFGFGRNLSNQFLAGATLNWNRRSPDDDLTLTLGLVAFPLVRAKFQQLFLTERNLFNNAILPQKLALGLAIHDLPLGDREAKTAVEFGGSFRPHERFPVMHGAMHIKRGETYLSVATSLPVRHYANLIASIDNLNPSRSAFGVSLFFPRSSLDIAYNVASKSLFVDVSMRIGKNPVERARQYRRKGVIYTRQGKHKLALREINKYMAYMPEDSLARILRNLLVQKIQIRENQILKLFSQAAESEQKGWFIRAALIYKYILQLEEDNEKAQLRLSLIMPHVEESTSRLLQEGVRAYNQGDMRVAQRALKMVLKVWPEHEIAASYLAKVEAFKRETAEDLYYSGLGYYKQGNFATAIEKLKKALELDPSRKDASRYLELALAEQAKRERQIAQLFQRAKNQEKRSRFIEASNTYRQILAIDVQNDEARFALRRLEPSLKRQLEQELQQAQRHFANNEFDKARKIFQVLLNYENTSRTANIYLTRIERAEKMRIEKLYQEGLAAFDQKKWDVAIALFDSVLSLESNFDAAQNKRLEALAQSSIDELLGTAERYFQEGNYLKAIDYFRQVLARVPENPYIAARVQECMEALDATITHFFETGLNRFAHQDYLGAMRAFEEVLKINPEHGAARDFFEKCQNRVQAVKTLQ